MGKCQVFTLSLCRQTEGQMDGQMDNGKTICPQIFRYGGMKGKKYQIAMGTITDSVLIRIIMQIMNIVK